MSAASRRIADARAAGSPGGTRTALSPSVRSSRAATVSAVTSGAPHASAWNTLFGITRAALSLAPKMPSEQPADRIACGICSCATQRSSTFAGRSRSSSGASWPLPRSRTECPARAEPRRGSSRARGGGSTCRRTGIRRSRGFQPGENSGSSAPRKQTSSGCAGSGQLREVVGVGLGVRDHEVGGPHRSSVDRPEHARLRRPSDDGRDRRRACRRGTHRVEDDGFRACGPPGMSKSCPGYPTTITSESGLGSARGRRCA